MYAPPEQVIIMKRDEAGRDVPASKELSAEGASFELVRLEAANPGTVFWTLPAPRSAP